MLKKLTATTCALALCLPVSMPCCADDFNDEIQYIIRNAGKLRHESSSRTASSSATYRDDPLSYLEEQTAEKLLQAFQTFNKNINGRIDELNGQIASMYAQLPTTGFTDEFHYAETETHLLQVLQNYRSFTVFAGAKDLFDDFWLTLGQVFSERQSYELEQTRIENLLENHQSFGSDNTLGYTTNTRLTMYVTLWFRSLDARIQQAHASLVRSIDALLRGRIWLEPEHNYATHKTHAPSDVIQKNEDYNQSCSSEESNLERQPPSTTRPLLRLAPSTESSSQSDIDEHQKDNQKSSLSDETSDRSEEELSRHIEPLDELLTRLRSTLPWISDGLYEYASNSIIERLTYGELPALREIPEGFDLNAYLTLQAAESARTNPSDASNEERPLEGGESDKDANDTSDEQSKS